MGFFCFCQTIFTLFLYLIYFYNSSDVGVWVSHMLTQVTVSRYPLSASLILFFRFHNAEGIKLPDSFDARKQWPDCPTIQQIRDQGSCGSCWVNLTNTQTQMGVKTNIKKIFFFFFCKFPQAFGAVEAISDRLCIHSGSKISLEISAEDLLSCCDECGMGWVSEAAEEA